VTVADRLITPFAALVFLVPAACGHGEPYAATDLHPTGAREPGAVARLTYSTGRDRSSGWASGGILYTYEDITTLGRPWCVGLLTDAGGSRTRSWCAQSDSLVAYDWASEGPGGELAYLRASSLPFALAPVTWGVMVSASGDPAHGTEISPVVLTLPGAPPLQGAEQLRWLDANRLVWLGMRRLVGAPCRTCATDTIQSGRLLLIQDTRQSGLPSALAGTDYATSVAVRGEDELLYTRGGDNRLHRYVVSTGVSTVLWDFAAAGVVRDVQVFGDFVVAVLGGTVTWSFDPELGDSIQRDFGGDLVTLDLVSGTMWSAGLPFSIRYPALARDGRRAVVQSVARPEDIYVVALP